MPFEAKTCEMPTPIVPAPTIATRAGQGHGSQRRPQQRLELGRADLLRRADEQPALVERAADDRVEVVLAVPELAQARRRADVLEQALERRREVVAAVEQPGRLRAPLRVRRPR